MKLIKWLSVLVLAIASSLYTAYVYTFLWAWFIVPVTSWPTLTIPMAFGLMLTIAYLRISGREVVERKKIYGEDKTTLDNKEKIIATVINLFADTILFGMGYIVTLFL